MRAIHLVAGMLILGSVFCPVGAQNTPNLSGTWASPPELVAKVPLPAIGATGTGVKGVAVQRITQSGDTVAVTGNGLTYKYAVNGGETTNCLRSEGRCFDNKCRARWEGAVLMTTCRVIWESGREAITTQRYSIDADGNLRVAGLHTTQGVTVTYQSIYVKQGTIVFELGEVTR